MKNEEKNTLFGFAQRIINQQKELGKIRLAANYHDTLRSFKSFRKNRNLPLSSITSQLMAQYESSLRLKGLARNTISYYMRNLRAIYNRAVEYQLTPQNHPFRHVYTGVDKTVKRAITLQDVRRIRQLDLSQSPQRDFARQLFLFSFYTRGMAFVDMAYLRKTDVSQGVLTYRRRKTGQTLVMAWEPEMQQVVNSLWALAAKLKRFQPYLSVKNNPSPYLLPILFNEDEIYLQYREATRLANIHLRNIGRQLMLPIHLTTYVARHTWASSAHSMDVPISVISSALGHDSEKTTQIYLASLDVNRVNQVNRMLLLCLSENTPSS